MPFVDVTRLDPIERKRGWHGRYFQSPGMAFVWYEFEAGSSIHRHFHPREEVWQVIEGELEITVDGIAPHAGPGTAAILLPNVPHSVKALTNGKAVIVDYPLRNLAG
jgi:quercetin dioxygenase-like cupin family protein